ncbi:MAG: U32 family peptidase [Oscillospiraceae bacterium]|nr:U32 family peptidase [Oscillospiraceae bacterium]
MMELLAPAGSPEAVIAAVQSGADAVYLGCGSLNARRNAVNFTEEELQAAVEYCHLRGAKVYLTLNTLLYDRELEAASALVRYADSIGVDALLVQDLGVLRMARQTAPDLPIHASTQMTLHSLDGIKLAADLGVSRAVLSRELSKEQIADLCARSPIELEVFVHGALCMCYSGQCFLSSVIGGRSGNRGLCAQPCRLKYGWNGRANGELLSLKDLALVRHLQELEDMGVACAKIEGRMKRPEYVAVVTGIYASVLRQRRWPTQEELKRLEAAFSRQGFTEGYYQGKKGPAMFGVHQDSDTDPTPMFKAAKADYSRGERPRVPVTLSADIRRNAPATVTVRDGDGHEVTVSGPTPEDAVKRALTKAEAEQQLAKTGGTPYLAQADCQVEPGLALPLSALNRLRREALDGLSAQRIQPPKHNQYPWTLPPAVRAREPAPVRFAVSIQRWEQLTEELLRLQPVRVEIPLELAGDKKRLTWAAERCSLALVLPRILWDAEREQAVALLRAAKAAGVTLCLCSTWGGVALAQSEGFSVAGDFGLGVTNSETLRGLRALGLVSATLSFEQRLARLRDLSRELPWELIVYGRLPLMVMENCIIANRTGGNCQRACQSGDNCLTDRRGARFPVVRAYGCRNELLNSRVLYLADKPDYQNLGCQTYRLLFTLETPEECVSVLRQYLGLEQPRPQEITRGLYYRDVE